MCSCQAFGKSGVPNARGYCLVCGERVEEPAARPSYICPRCGAVSYNPHDIAERYCGRCHQFEEP